MTAGLVIRFDLVMVHNEMCCNWHSAKAWLVVPSDHVGATPLTDEAESQYEAGTIVGSYEIVRHLGSGAFGAVYEARKRPLQKRVALKLLHETQALKPDVVARFMQEAQAASGLRHPHIVDIDDVGVIDGLPFIAMEFLEGESLADLLERERRLTIGEAVAVMLPICSAVAAVHENGIVHRDLKPDNIFLWCSIAGRVHPKLLDFGIAKVRESQQQGAALTQTRAILGTPLYMSPEQWAGSKNATPASDQWALGVILYESITGRFPFEAEELHALMLHVSLHEPHSLRSYLPEIPAGLERALMRTLEKTPRARHSSVRSFARALLPFADVGTRAMWEGAFIDNSALMSSDTLDRALEAPAPPSSVPRRVALPQGSIGSLGETSDERPRVTDTLSRSGRELDLVQTDTPRASSSVRGATITAVLGVVVLAILAGAFLPSALHGGTSRLNPPSGGERSPAQSDANLLQGVAARNPVVSSASTPDSSAILPLDVAPIDAVPSVPAVVAPPRSPADTGPGRDSTPPRVDSGRGRRRNRAGDRQGPSAVPLEGSGSTPSPVVAPNSQTPSAPII